MPLESATYISDLNTSNPVGSTDKVQTLDDHVRLIKSTLKTTFPNVNGAMTATEEQLNVLATDGAGAGMLADIAAIADPGADRVLGWDESANAAIAFSFSTGLTSSGTTILIDTAVVPQLGQANSWSITSASGIYQTAYNLSNNAAAFIAWRLGNDGSLKSYYGMTSTTYSAAFFTGGPTGQQTVVGNDGNIPLVFGTNNAARFVIDGSGNFDFGSGAVTTDNAIADEVGFKGTPQNAQNGDYTLVLTDAGKTIYKASGGAGETITIPANASVAFPVGTIVRIVNNGGGDLTIAIASDTLSLAGAGTTGSRTLSDHGVAVIEKVASTEWFISGAGVS